MKPLDPCLASFHNERAESYDGRIEVTEDFPEMRRKRCRVCGDEWLCVRQRPIGIIECEKKRQIAKELAHVRSHAECMPYEGDE